MAIRDILIQEFANNNLFTMADTIDLGFKKGSVSSALSRGVKTNNFKRLSMGIYKVMVIFYEKMLGTQNYCNGKRKNFLAVTIEKNDINRNKFLRTELDFIAGCSEARKITMGYQQRITSKRSPIYPGVEIIET